MIAIYVLMIAHILHWWITGRSVGRFVLSDSMETLELGRVNPGFILFTVGALVTVVFGRFLCGWACHMAGLQDLCAWILRRLGVRPHLFRSRLLGYVPISLAAYMFIWPTLKREVVLPVLQDVWPQAAAWLTPVPDFPGLTLHVTTTNLWSGLPSAAIAVPFLLLCGFGTVYFLGARGLCRYGCPYGGLFLPLEQLAPGRIVVDASKCDQCGLCTAACTAQVRVHDEIRAFGMVTDRNCVRSLDCVSACPHQALSFRFTRPAVLRGRAPEGESPRRRFDLSLSEELAAAAVFLLVFLVARGLYGRIPMLMAATLAAICAYIGWKTLRLARDRDVRVTGAQIKRAGRLTRSGLGFVGLTSVIVLLTAHSAAIRSMTWLAERADDRVRIGLNEVLADHAARVPSEMRGHAADALRWYGRADSLRRGGIGLAETPSSLSRRPWLLLVTGDWDRAKAELRAALQVQGPDDQNSVSLARILLAEGNTSEAESVLAEAQRTDQPAPESRDLLCLLWMQSGRAQLAEAAYTQAIAADSADRSALVGLGRLRLAANAPLDAAELLARAVKASPDVAAIRADLAVALASGGRYDEAHRELEAGIQAVPDARAQFVDLARWLFREVGRNELAAEWDRRVEATPTSPRDRR